MPSARPVEVAFVESFDGGSHAAFARGWCSQSRHRIRIVGLPAERWKWRMRLSAWTLGERVRRMRPRPDVVVASGLIDLAHLRLAGLASVPHLLYLHENQLSYPRPEGEALDRGFAVAHVASVLAADGIAINSRSHRDELAAAAAGFLEDAPTPVPRGVVSRIERARVLAPGLDLAGFPPPAPRPCHEPPVVVWNHRWEEDKRPSAFARIMKRLAEAGVPFRLALLGTTSQVVPKPRLMLEEELAERIVTMGPARTRAAYVAALCRSDVVVSTAAQENFGYAVLEAMAAGAVPILPRRLSYPEILPQSLHESSLYDRDVDLERALEARLRDPASVERCRVGAMRAARRHAWPERAAKLDAWVEDAL